MMNVSLCDEMFAVDNILIIWTLLVNYLLQFIFNLVNDVVLASNVLSSALVLAFFKGFTRLMMTWPWP